MIDAIWQSTAIFFIMHLSYRDQADTDVLSFGFVLIFSMMLTSLLHVLLQTSRIDLPMIGSIVLSFGLFLGFSLVFDATCVNCIPGENPYYVSFRVLRQGRFWFATLLATVTALLPRFTVKCLYNSLANPLL